MNYRMLGKTSLRVSEIGYGAWGIGGELWQGNDDAESLRALGRAVDLGLNFIDTALAYGNGHSEQLIGSLLRERKEQLIIATKIPPKNGKWPARPKTRIADVFPPEYIRSCTERSLKNLGIETIDLQQLHVWNDDWTAEGEWWEEIGRLRTEGKIRWFGISINDHQPENGLELIATGRVDVVQVIYNIFDQTPERRLFDACIRNNIGVIVRVPFDEGSLTGSITPHSVFPPRDFRNNYFGGDRKQQVHARVGKLREMLGPEAESLAELALRFCLSQKAVSTIIPGMRSTRNVEANCAVSDARVLSSGLLQQLKQHAWDRNFYNQD